MQFSIQSLCGLTLAAAIALGWWSAYRTGKDAGAEAERQQIRDVLVRLITEGELQERQISSFEEHWQINTGLIQDHEKRIRAMESP
jgi:hypothetical protein